MIGITRIMLLAAAVALIGCSTSTTRTQAAPTAKSDAPQFDADSAFSFVAQQTAFGPRVPGSDASRQCAQWLTDKLAQYGAQSIKVQSGNVKAYNGDDLPIANISAQFNPQAPKRILLVSHWDSRPWADQDPDPARRNMPIDGANDGASGVGVILEIARLISQQAPKVGVDVLFVDAEDYGRRHDEDESLDGEDGWCLGTQYWMQDPTLDPSAISYGILLDMVGGKDAIFQREYFSQQIGKSINDKVWRAAKRIGFGAKFADSVGTPVLDDHLYLNAGGINTIDIIENGISGEQAFNHTWHTHADNIDNIDRNTLKAVGQTVTEVIYSEL